MIQLLIKLGTQQWRAEPVCRVLQFTHECLMLISTLVTDATNEQRHSHIGSINHCTLFQLFWANFTIYYSSTFPKVLHSDHYSLNSNKFMPNLLCSLSISSIILKIWQNIYLLFDPSVSHSACLSVHSTISSNLYHHVSVHLSIHLSIPLSTC